VTSGPELPRWTEGAELPDPLRHLLEASRSEQGTREQVAVLAQSLARVLGPRAGVGDVPLAAPSAPLRARGRWLSGVIGGAATLAGLWWAFANGPTPLPAPTPSVPSLVAQAPPEPSPAAPAVAPSPPVPEPAAVAEARPDDAMPLTVPRKPGRSRPTEAELLERAQAALRAEPARALALTREHRRRYPAGALVQEREVIAIEALRRLGRDRAASHEADVFGERYPGSVHHNRLEQTHEPTPQQVPSPPHARAPR
jgi:hypothetical protein